ncbi:MAG: alpha-hydroxy acid oxidase [Hyphomicrobiales bacterium]
MFGPAPIITVEDARQLARRRLPAMVFDYIDGAAGEEYGESENRKALQEIDLPTRVLRDVETRSIKGQLFGQETGLPFAIAPMGMCNLSAPGADYMLARLAAKHKIPLGVSTFSSTSLEKIIEAAEGHAWFQLYYSAERAAAEHFVKRAEASGYDVLIFTVDVPELGKRPRELRRGFKIPFKMGVPQFLDCAFHPRWSLTSLFSGIPGPANFEGPLAGFNRSASRAGADWDYLGILRDLWKGKLVVKGVVNAEDALRLKKTGVDAVQVSSHGGRQLDSAPLPIRALPKIREVVGPDYPLFYDSGIRSGEDVVKAYRTGADFVFVGRPFQYSIAAAGERGLEEICDILASDVSVALAMMGLKSIDEIKS